MLLAAAVLMGCRGERVVEKSHAPVQKAALKPAPTPVPLSAQPMLPGDEVVTIGPEHYLNPDSERATLTSPDPVPGAAEPGAGEAPATGWIPKEHDKGAGRWKDSYVYVDGLPVGILAFAELPASLKPTWANSDHWPGEEPTKVRRYRFTDLVTSLGVKLSDVREIHVYGPRPSETIVVSGAELARRPDFMFRFGAEIYGKPIPVVPANLGNGRSPDKISAVTIYVKRKPPRRVPNEGFYLGNKFIDGIPYFGEPVRGGIRIYKDDRLVAIIKRRELDELGLAAVTPGAQASWKLYAFLQARDVKTDDLVEGQFIYDELRTSRISGAALREATFKASSQAKGEISIAGNHAHAIALYSRPITDEMTASFQPTEEEMPWR